MLETTDIWGGEQPQQTQVEKICPVTELSCGMLDDGQCRAIWCPELDIRGQLSELGYQ